MQKQDKKLVDNLTKEARLALRKFFLISIVPAILAVIIGKFIDDALGIKPLGTLGLLTILYIISQVIIFRNIRSLRKEK